MGNVDVCIPCMNGGVSLKATVDSCFSNQRLNKVIIGLNACTDNSLDIARSIENTKIQIVVFRDRVEMMESWIRTLRLSSSQYVKLLPCGDLAVSGALDKQESLISRYRDEQPALASSGKRVSHRNTLLEKVLNYALSKAKEKTWEANLEDLASEMFNHPRNPFGEPGSIIFDGELLRRMLSNTRARKSLIHHATCYPYVVDLALYLTTLEFSKSGLAVFSNAPLCNFEISKNSGTWRLRTRQSRDLLGYLIEKKIPVSTFGSLRAYIDHFIRYFIYAFS